METIPPPVEVNTSHLADSFDLESDPPTPRSQNGGDSPTQSACSPGSAVNGLCRQNSFSSVSSSNSSSSNSLSLSSAVAAAATAASTPPPIAVGSSGGNGSGGLSTPSSGNTSAASTPRPPPLLVRQNSSQGSGGSASSGFLPVSTFGGSGAGAGGKPQGLTRQTSGMGSGMFSMVDLETPKAAKQKKGGLFRMKSADSSWFFSHTSADVMDFLENARKIDEELKDIKGLLVHVHDAVNDIRNLTSALAVKTLGDSMRSDLDKCHRRVGSVKTKLSALLRDNEASKRTAGCQEGSPTFQIRTTVVKAICNKLKRRQKEAADVLQRMNSGIRETVKKRYTAVANESPSEELVDYLCSPNQRQCFFIPLPHRQLKNNSLDELLKEMSERHSLAVDLGDKLDSLQSSVHRLIDMIVDSGQIGDSEKGGSVERRHGCGQSSHRILCLVMLAFAVLCTLAFIPTVEHFVGRQLRQDGH